eukprot:COSAG02_NODE_40325_length_406_cov_23.172638_1_plen_58_part_01
MISIAQLILELSDLSALDNNEGCTSLAFILLHPMLPTNQPVPFGTTNLSSLLSLHAAL